MHRTGSRPAPREDPQRIETRGARRGASAAAVLRAVLDHGPIARSTIARRTGLSPALVTGHSAELTKLGFLRELPEVAGPKVVGRPHVPVDLDTGRHVLGSLHIAVHHATVALLDVRGHILASHEEPHQSLDPQRILSRAAGILLELLDRHAPDREPLGLGMATGGWVDRASGVVVEHPLLGWHDVPARELLAGHTGLTVAVDSHSRALVNAERLLGHARARASVVQLFTGNVVDAAFATGDTVHHGPRSAAGAVAHLPIEGGDEPCPCGRTGCLQAMVSEQTVARRAGEQGITTTGSFPELLTEAKTGNPRAIQLLVDRVRLIGQASALLLDVLNPEILVVVDQSVSQVPACLPALRDEVQLRSRICEDAPRTVVSTSFPGSELATSGGAVLLDRLFQDPLSPLS
ncbi:MAG: family transcriptional regulator [Amycolatopsis sp.]|jgi:predicted NBD/HSP70 family sugar kinase|uniref:ROK family protein n=1 Tax=Amycolatopsis sp. TaxID=37632 RepID=UPI002618B898|nr:ROK family protein [Amycolatopsis sp.]MCU1679587.1 family transcriptional regulator [Amycolatopsis sp.]